MNTDIIATIGAKKTNVTSIEYLIDAGITHLRFNFSKFTNECEERIEEISTIKQKYKNDLRTMLDIPYPQKKVRIYSAQNYFHIKKNEIIHMTSMASSNETCKLFADLVDIGSRIVKGDVLLYSDGEGEFVVEQVLSPYKIVLSANNDFLFRSGKSINIICRNDDDHTIKQYSKIIQDISPDEIALSFVENIGDVLNFKSKFIALNDRCEIYSKIETQCAVNNIDSILKQSNAIIGRGDLCLHSNYCELYDNQAKIVDAAKNNGKKVYIATGILSSLINQSIPSQSDIIDLSVIKRMNIDGVIINSVVAFEATTKALSIIRRI